MPLFSHKTKDSLMLIIDIQSSIVRGTLILFREGELPNISWTSNIDIPYRPLEGSSYFINTAIKAVESLATAAHVYVHSEHVHSSPFPEHISGVHCVLSSPWIVSQARTISQKFDKDTRITRSHVKDIITAERNRLAKSGGESMVAVEEKIFDVRLNGYSISEWENTVGVSFEVSFAISLAGKSTIEHFTESCKKAGVSAGHVHFHSSLLLQYLGIGIIFSFNEPYILVHTHGELTDIVVANAQSCILFGSYPMGIRTIIRQLATDLKVTEPTADSKLALYEDTIVDPLHIKKDVKAIQDIAAVWVDACAEITSSIQKNYHPSRVIISSRTHESFFKEAFGVAHPTFKIENLPSETLYKLITFNAQAEKIRLTILYMSAIHSLEML